MFMSKEKNTYEKLKCDCRTYGYIRMKKNLVDHPMYAEYNGNIYRVVDVNIAAFSHSISIAPEDISISEDQYVLPFYPEFNIQTLSEGFQSLDRIFYKDRKGNITFKELIKLFYQLH